MKEIIINSKKYGKQIVLVNDEDYYNINQYKWHVKNCKLKNSDSDEKLNNYKLYAYTNTYTTCESHTISMHHMLIGKPEKGFVIDHINGNSLDNTRNNLRKITIQQNNQNKKPKNTYLGVCWDKNAKKYKSASSGQHIGCFDDKKEAAVAYDKYMIREKGATGDNCSEDWRLNFQYTQEEINRIKNEVVEEKKERILPEYIILTVTNTYRVQFRKDDYKVNKTYKTLEEAILFKDKCLEEIKKNEEEKLRLHYQKPITYNKEGIAYILVKCKEQEYECLVDDDKWHDLSLIGWYFAKTYVQGRVNGTPEKIHRYIYKCYNPNEDITDKKIDHIDGKDEISKRLDNRISNLRTSTSGQNNYNKQTTNSLGYRGVRQNNKKYYAYIKYNKKLYWTKMFAIVEEAALAYNELAIHYYKDRAMINKII